MLRFLRRKIDSLRKTGNMQQIRGKSGEESAKRFLKKKGYRIREQNYRTRFGEIDIIAEDGDYLVFIEVKMRKTADFSHPSCYVDSGKQNKIIKCAQIYLTLNRLHDMKCRFDVVSIIGSEKNIKAELIKDAFQEGG